MPGGGTDWLDQLAIWLFAGVATLLAGIAFVSIMEGWRRWSDNRRIKQHLGQLPSRGQRRCRLRSRRSASDRGPASRVCRSESEDLSRNSFAGSHVSHVRGFLNRLLGIGARKPDSPEEEAAAHKIAFDLGDKTANVEVSAESDVKPLPSLDAFDEEFGREQVDVENHAMKGGVEFNEPLPEAQRPTETETETDEERARRAAIQRRTNREQMIDAVAELCEAVAERAQDGGLRYLDLSRLRAIHMNLAAVQRLPGSAIDAESRSGSALRSVKLHR
jgi:hypothetical protein